MATPPLLCPSFHRDRRRGRLGCRFSSKLAAESGHAHAELRPFDREFPHVGIDFRQQTLAILLTTPIQSAELMKQKARALRHIALVCALVIGSSAVASVFVSPGLNPWIYLFTVMLELLFYLPIVYWVGMIIGARSSNWRRAVMFVFLILTAIIVMPFLALDLPVFTFFAILSPTGFIVANELQTGVSLFNYLM